jgi:hypothetical protein
MGAWSTASLVSRSDEEARPERARASARSSGSCVVESLHENGWEKGSPGVPEQGKVGGGRRGDAGSPMAVDVYGNPAAVLQLRRTITTA